jgi:hypothetical protein
MPMRKPVYEPGPALTAMASGNLVCSRAKASVSSINTGRLVACEGPSVQILENKDVPFSESVVEHTSVAVSICKIVAIMIINLLLAKIRI